MFAFHRKHKSHEYFSGKFSLIQEVGSCRTRGESTEPLCAGNKEHKRGIYPVFETQDRRYRKSRIMVSAAPLKRLMSCKKELKYRILKKSGRKETFYNTNFFQFQKFLPIRKNISMRIALCALGI